MKHLPRILTNIPQLFAASLASLMAVAPAAAAEKPVKVYILSGQSNMVGIGQVSGSSARWVKEFSDAVLSVYAGTPDAAVDYDTLKPGQGDGGNAKKIRFFTNGRQLAKSHIF